MSTSTTPTPPEAAAVPAAAVPANEYQRFLAALPEPLRKECQARLSGGGFAANHPRFRTLADFYEKTGKTEETVTEQKEFVRDFLQEATLHANQAKQLLADFQKLPQAILAQIEPQLVGLLSALTDPVEKLAVTATHVQGVAARLPKRPEPTAPPANPWKWPFWWLGNLFQTGRFLLADHLAWMVTGAISLSVAGIILSVGAARLSRSYEESYQERVAHLEADSAQDTVALNHLLAAGIALQVQRNKENDGYFLILQGAHKAAQPVNSPEGLAVEVWP